MHCVTSLRRDGPVVHIGTSDENMYIERFGNGELSMRKNHGIVTLKHREYVIEMDQIELLKKWSKEHDSNLHHEGD